MPDALPPDTRALRRAQIVAAARRLVADGGLEALTFSALESQLAFTRGVITHHFRDKAEIAAAVLDDAVAEIDAATQTALDGDFANRVRAVLATKVDGFLAHREASRVLLAYWGRLPSDPHAAQASAALFARYRREARALLAWGRRRGEVGAHVDLDAAAALLVGTVIGIVTQALIEEEAVGVDAAVEAATGFFVRPKRVRVAAGR